MRSFYRFNTLTLLSIATLLLIDMNPSFAGQQTTTQHAANSPGNYNHCTLSGTSPCSGANEGAKGITDTERNDPTKKTWSGRAGAGPARVAVDLDNACRWVDKASANTDATELFVPFRTRTEWLAFVNNAPSNIVSLAACARPSVIIPPNDPAGNHQGMKCYNEKGAIQTVGKRYTNLAYGRVGENRTFSPTNVTFSCYALDKKGPFSKTVESISITGLSADRPGGTSSNRINGDWLVRSVTYTTPTALCGTANGAAFLSPPSGNQLCGYGVASAVGGSGPWTWTCRGLKNTASCTAYKPVNGSCGSANAKNLTTAPLPTELCSTGTASAVSGSGPWSWSCNGLYGGTNASCAASKVPPTCPPVSVYGPPGPLGPIAQPLNDGFMYIKVHGVYHGTAHSNGAKSWDSLNSKWVYYRFGSCYWPNFMLSGTKEQWVNCIVTEYVKNNVAGYSNMTDTCDIPPDTYLSPLKVNLAESNPSMNSTQPTTFYLTLSDGRILEGKATGGLNPDEGWLMVHRTKDPLVFRNGALNADNWFGDRDGRTLNGFTDLAETFSSFIETDDNGQRFIPLNVLTDEEKRAKAEYAANNPGQLTDPSFDLRIIDARNVERFASDYFSRLYVDYRNVVEADGKDGKLTGSKNVVLERGIARTVNGKNNEVLDQWFILNLPTDPNAPKGPTASRILPAKR